MPATLHDGRFARTQRLLGEAGMARLTNAFVCIVGLGAVGSYAIEALARAGVGKLRLVDFDEIRLSNINRQLYATSSTIGRKKCDVARQRVLDINPNCHVQTLEVFVHTDTIEQVLAGDPKPPDLVIDAIDSFTPKQILLEALHLRGIPVISSMGAAMRADPLQIRIGPLAEVHTCPLAAKLRKALRKRGVPINFTCVYSTEPVLQLPDDSADLEAPQDEQSLERGRKRRTLGSLPTLTGIFGLIAANAAIDQLAGLPKHSDQSPTR